eukprot:scaffold170758_cov24-Cyclotella_meneghiniana.AAC.2
MPKYPHQLQQHSMLLQWTLQKLAAGLDQLVCLRWDSRGDVGRSEIRLEFSDTTSSLWVE